jgi:hypothetical protein
MRIYAVLLSLVLTLARSAGAQVTPNVELFAATAVDGGKTEVRLQVRVVEGWLPSEGIRIYRELNGAKQEVFRSKPVDNATVDRLVDPSLRGKTLWTEASRTLVRRQALDFKTFRPPSSAARFRDSKMATRTILDARAKGAKDAASRGALDAGLSQLRQARSLTAPALGRGTARPVVAQPSADDRTIAARSNLLLSTLVDREAAVALGFAATDKAVKPGDTPTYSIVAVTGGRDGATLATLRFTVGSDPQPPAPTNIDSMQLLLETGDPTGKIAVRWDRIDPALEAKLLNISYRIERFESAPRPRNTEAKTDRAIPTPPPASGGGKPGKVALPDISLPAGGGKSGTTPSFDTNSPKGLVDVAGTWKPATRKPLMISVLEGNVEPESFFTDTVEVPGTHRYRIQLVDGFGRVSAWVPFEAGVVDWRRPDAPHGVTARLDEQPRDERGAPLKIAGVKPTGDQLRAMGMQAQRKPIGLDRAVAKPRDLSALSSAILSGQGRAAVVVDWKPIVAPKGLTARYRIYRIDADLPNAEPSLLMPEPIEGDPAPPDEAQRAAEQELLKVELDIGNLGPPQQVWQLADARRIQFRGLQSRKAALQSDATPRRTYTDRSVKVDSKYQYLVRAVFIESGLESGDAVTPVVGVPSPHRPPAVAQVSFLGFVKSESLAGNQLADPSVAARAGEVGEGMAREVVPFALARQGKPRLAPPPRGFKPAAALATRSFSLSKSLDGPLVGRRGSRSSPGAVSGSEASEAESRQDVRELGPGTAVRRAVPNFDIEIAQLARRVPALNPELVAKLGGNLFRGRDDGGTVRLEWTAVPNLRDVKYRVRRKVEGGNFVEIGVTPPNSTKFIDAVPRSVARTYVYEITPISRWGVMGQVAKASTTNALVPSTVLPTKPNLLSAAPDSSADSAIKLRIDPNPVEESVGLYRIYRDGREVGQAKAALNSGEIEFIDEGLDPARKQPYQYKVIAETAIQLRSEESRVIAAKAVRLEVAAPTQFGAAVNARGVTLNWTASPNAVSYMVLRRDAKGGAPSLLAADVQGNTFTDTMAYSGNAYIYEVIARDALGTPSRSAQTSVTLP